MLPAAHTQTVRAADARRARLILTLDASEISRLSEIFVVKEARIEGSETPGRSGQNTFRSLFVELRGRCTKA